MINVINSTLPRNYQGPPLTNLKVEKLKIVSSNNRGFSLAGNLFLTLVHSSTTYTQAFNLRASTFNGAYNAFG